ncbi:MAG: RimK/LysX family protein [Spirochaetota bacterium]|nr:RimK/LysX family protein [Spirochaetota bacterium]
MQKIVIVNIFCAILLLFCSSSSKIIIGRAEKVRVYPSGLLVRAKIDTGALNSSLNSRNISYFKRDNQDWVRFEIHNYTDNSRRKGKKMTVERPLLRITEIRQKGRPDEKRPAVIMGICLANKYTEVEVNLVDRRNFNYPMLIGRSFLSDNFLVDASVKNVTKPTCENTKIE